MFQGSLPEKAIKVICNIAKNWKCNNIYIGCCGNLSIERSLAKFYKGNIFSCDVTIYSSTLGRFFARKDLEIEWNDNYKGRCQYLQEYCDTPIETVATMLLATDIMKFDNPDEKYMNAYAYRMLNAYEAQFPELHEKTVKTLKAIKLRLTDFYCGDVMDYLDNIKKDGGFISFPPFYKGGYEHMWKDLERIFIFEKPEYNIFDPEKDIHNFARKVKRMENFIIGTERLLPEFKEYYSSTVLTGNGKPIYLYSSDKKHKIYVKGKKRKYTLSVKRLSPERETIGSPDNIKLCQLNHGQFDELRSVYLDKGIAPKTECAAYGVFTKDKDELLGCFAFSSSLTLTDFQTAIDGPTIYLMSDFSVRPTKIPKLSKLVLYCVLSKETRFLAERCKNGRVNSIVTNAFCNNPVSMKYRGLFELLHKRKVKNDVTGKDRYNICYGQYAGLWSLEEGVEKWLQKL